MSGDAAGLAEGAAIDLGFLHPGIVGCSPRAVSATTARPSGWAGPRRVRGAVVARLMVRPVCPQLRKCRGRPGSYAWCQFRTSCSQFISSRRRTWAETWSRARSSKSKEWLRRAGCPDMRQNPVGDPVATAALNFGTPRWRGSLKRLDPFCHCRQRSERNLRRIRC